MMMRVMCFVLGLLALLPTAALAASSVAIPDGTQLSVNILTHLDSGRANVGDPFTFKTVDPVLVDGFVVVRRGAQGQGTVVKVDRAGRNGHAGSLSLRFDYVYGVDGKKIWLRNTKDRSAAGAVAGKMSTATVIGVLALGYVGLLAHNLVRGKNVTVSNTQLFVAYIKGGQRVVSSDHPVDVNNPFGP